MSKCLQNLPDEKDVFVLSGVIKGLKNIYAAPLVICGFVLKSHPRCSVIIHRALFMDKKVSSKFKYLSKLA